MYDLRFVCLRFPLSGDSVEISPAYLTGVLVFLAIGSVVVWSVVKNAFERAGRSIQAKGLTPAASGQGRRLPLKTSKNDLRLAALCRPT